MTDAVRHEDLRDAFLLCRTLGHSWDEINPATVESFHLRCTRCGTERIDVASRASGGIESRRYQYPNGYQIDETVTRSELRLEWMRRRQNRYTTITKRKPR